MAYFGRVPNAALGSLSAGCSPGGDHANTGAANGFAANYPAVDAGIPAVLPSELCERNADLVRRIKLAYGSDDATFERDILALVRRFAAYVHLLPATPDNYFRNPGGLLRMSLETAFYALQATDSHIFSGRTTITKRRHLEPRWRYATFLAGLCCELHRTLTHLVVVDESGCQWPSYLGALHHWLVAKDRPHYFLRWVAGAQEVRALGVFALPHVISAETLAYLADDNAVVVPHMMACLAGMPIYREANVLEELVRRALALVIDRDLAASADRFGKPRVGAHLVRYLLDAMRRLLASSPAWTINGEKSRVWYAQDGVYLIWPNAMTDISAALEKEQLPAMPKTPETLFEILFEAGVLVAQDTGEPRWKIQPPQAEAPLEAMRLASASILLSALEAVPEALVTLAPRPRAPPVVPAAGAPGDETGQLELDMAAPPDVLRAVVDIAPNRVLSTDQQPSSFKSAQVSVQPASVRIALQAPARLHPAVRSALAELIDALNDPGSEVPVRIITQGVFVSLQEFERRKLETALVIRALDECAMLVTRSNRVAKTLTHNFRGKALTGVVIQSRFVAGLSQADGPRDTRPEQDGAGPQV